ncbi:hypothetical protein L5515_004367 [Caenorhabditis briggsae]|nr:hypothetical protein L5515_004367 [Caenorhabditis briggsae]
MSFDNLFNYAYAFVILSYIYMLLTVGVVWKMYKVYYANKMILKAIVVHRCLFQTFIWMQIANLLFFIFDNIVFRLPSTGFFTKLCDYLAPSHLLKVLYMLQLFSNYSSIYYSFLFCLTRLIILFITESHEKICKKLCFVFIPITLITPIIADFYMIPAPGACRPLKPPYPPGAISISYGPSLFNIRTDNFMLGLTFFAPVAILFMNAMVVFKVRKLLFQRRKTTSRHHRKAQISLTITTLAIMVQHLASGGKTVVGVIHPEFVPYAQLIRNRVIDFGMISVPWIFYFSHPMFHDKTARVSSMT